jgi:hypothetical protein
MWSIFYATLLLLAWGVGVFSLLSYYQHEDKKRGINTDNCPDFSEPLKGVCSVIIFLTITAMPAELVIIILNGLGY